MQLFQRKIDVLVTENYRYARALNSLGIDFSKFKYQKLNDVLCELGIPEFVAINRLYEVESKFRPSFTELANFPIDFLIEYLKHSHRNYIKNLLPYIQDVISKLPDHLDETILDLKVVFPLFVEDFIHHIYEEEDKLFSYILILDKLSRKSHLSSIEIPSQFIDYSLEEVFEDHVDEDEMKSLRELINQISSSSLEVNVILSEIKNFDRELAFHAEIENQLLFPKAIELEQNFWNEIHGIK